MVRRLARSIERSGFSGETNSHFGVHQHSCHFRFIEICSVGKVSLLKNDTSGNETVHMNALYFGLGTYVFTAKRYRYSPKLKVKVQSPKAEDQKPKAEGRSPKSEGHD